MLLNDILKHYSQFIELIIISDPFISNSIKILDIRTNCFLRKKLKIKFSFIEWNISDFSSYISNCDLAIIPIDKKNKMMWLKPENKLLLFWEIGIPTITSNTPAYKQVMDSLGINLYCCSSADWLMKIQQFLNLSLNEKKLISQKCSEFISLNHNKDIILSKWDKIFSSLN